MLNERTDSEINDAKSTNDRLFFLLVGHKKVDYLATNGSLRVLNKPNIAAIYLSEELVPELYECFRTLLSDSCVCVVGPSANWLQKLLIVIL